MRKVKKCSEVSMHKSTSKQFEDLLDHANEKLLENRIRIRKQLTPLLYPRAPEKIKIVPIPTNDRMRAIRGIVLSINFQAFCLKRGLYTLSEKQRTFTIKKIDKLVQSFTNDIISSPSLVKGMVEAIIVFGQVETIHINMDLFDQISFYFQSNPQLPIIQRFLETIPYDVKVDLIEWLSLVKKADTLLSLWYGQSCSPDLVRPIFRFYQNLLLTISKEVFTGAKYIELINEINEWLFQMSLKSKWKQRDLKIKNEKWFR